MDLSDSPPPSPGPPRAPANGLKLKQVIVLAFALVAVYGQWQHFRRAEVESVTVLPTPNVSPTPSPNESP
jgi:hypothetical protein